MNIIFLDFCLFLAVFGGLKKGKMAVGRSSMVGRNQLRNLNILLSAQLAEVEFGLFSTFAPASAHESTARSERRLTDGRSTTY